MKTVRATDVQCPKCAAVPGKRCRFPSGATRTPHEARQKYANHQSILARVEAEKAATKAETQAAIDMLKYPIRETTDSAFVFTMTTVLPVEGFTLQELSEYAERLLDEARGEGAAELTEMFITSVSVGEAEEILRNRVNYAYEKGLVIDPTDQHC